MQNSCVYLYIHMYVCVCVLRAVAFCLWNILVRLYTEPELSRITASTVTHTNTCARILHTHTHTRTYMTRFHLFINEQNIPMTNFAI